MRKIILCGTGQIARALLDTLPYGSVACLCDYREKNIGKRIRNIDIISFQKLKQIYEDYDVLIATTADGDHCREMLSELGIPYWNYELLKENSYFNRADFIERQDEGYLEKYRNDFSLKDHIFYRPIDCWYREDYFSETNKRLLSLCRDGRRTEVELFLKEYYNRNDDTVYADTFYANRPCLRLIRRLMAEQGTKAICDMACGNGELIKKLKEDGHQCAAVDVAAEKIEELRLDGVDARLGTVEQVPFGDGEFDAVISTENLEHIYDPAAGIKEMRRILKPGGKLFISVPWGKYNDCHSHVRQFDESALLSLLLDHGFEINNIIRMPYINSSGENNIFAGASKNTDDKAE